MPQKLSRIQVIDRAHEVHGYKYIYDKMNYVDMNTKSCIICKEHGEFWQTPYHHLKGEGCKLCGKLAEAKKKTKPFSQFVEDANKIFGDEYDYDENTYSTASKNMRMICHIHGDFWKRPNDHLHGQGCPKCSQEKTRKRLSGNINDFISKSIEIHGDKYIYSGKYVNAKTPMEMICKIHGSFMQTPDAHLHGAGCPRCGFVSSKGEDEINDFINKSCHVNTVVRDKKIIDGLESDIIVPSHKLIIEFDGLRWHSEKFGKDKKYHLHKTELAESKGYHLIHIFEDEWLEHKDLVLSKIKHYLNCDLDKSIIDISEIVIKTLSKPLSEQFLTTYHLQGFSSSTALYGAFYGDILVGVMTLKKEREGVWNFNRFATNTDYRLPCLANKMFEQFTKDNNPIEVKAFLDRRWSCCDENVYNEMGFTLNKVLPPDYEYAHRQQRFPKSKFTKHNLAKEHNFPLSMTEKEMAEKLGYYRIWDCGQYKYVWKPSTYM